MKNDTIVIKILFANSKHVSMFSEKDQLILSMDKDKYVKNTPKKASSPGSEEEPS